MSPKELACLQVDDLSCLLGSDWVGGEHLWRVGFHVSALSLIPLLSGLVEILMTIYEPHDDVLVLIVRSLDKTGVLFREGALRANQIQRYRQVDQDILVLADPIESDAAFIG